MDGIIRLTDAQRKSALEHFRFGANARISRLAHILLLLDQGLSYRAIMEVMFCGSDTVAKLKRKLQEEGLESAPGIAKEVGPAPEWSDVVCDWVSNSTPQDFGYFRTRWSCEILSEVLIDQEIANCSGETVRRWMHYIGFVWRRPRPIVGPSDPHYDWKMRGIRRLLHCPHSAPVNLWSYLAKKPRMLRTCWRAFRSRLDSNCCSKNPKSTRGPKSSARNGSHTDYKQLELVWALVQRQRHPRMQ